MHSHSQDLGISFIYLFIYCFGLVYAIGRAMGFITDTFLCMTFPEWDIYQMYLASSAMILSSHRFLTDESAFSVSTFWGYTEAAKQGQTLGDATNVLQLESYVGKLNSWYPFLI